MVVIGFLHHSSFLHITSVEKNTAMWDRVEGGTAMSEVAGSLGSPAPGHDGRVENAVGARDTRHLHDQWQSKELVIALAVGLVCVFHLTNTWRRGRRARR